MAYTYNLDTYKLKSNQIAFLNECLPKVKFFEIQMSSKINLMILDTLVNKYTKVNFLKNSNVFQQPKKENTIYILYIHKLFFKI